MSKYFLISHIPQTLQTSQIKHNKHTGLEVKRLHIGRGTHE